jgi:hypothetical protein
MFVSGYDGDPDPDQGFNNEENIFDEKIVIYVFLNPYQ